MRGDFSRIRFEPNKHYTSVLEQQGRVALDADHNEQRAIDETFRRTEIIDVIGPFGGPENDEGFAISIQGNSIQIGAGRYYVLGLLCEAGTTLDYDSQPYLINPAIAGAELLRELSSGAIDSIRLFLEVWQRLVTPLDDPCLREPALGQADTTVRLQTVWRVVAERTLAPRPRPFPLPSGLLDTAVSRTNLASTLAPISALPVNPAVDTPPARLSELLTPVGGLTIGGIRIGGTSAGSVSTGGTTAAPVDCCQQMYVPPAPRVPGKLAAQTTGSAADCSCQPTPAAGFRGIENQLYRVEIHQGGSAGNATFVWSRENGSVAVAVTSVGGADVVVASLGPDANLGFQPGEWVELIDDTYLFGPQANQPGELFQIKNVKAEQLTLTMTAAVTNIDPKRNARVRRWEQSGLAATANGVPIQPGTWIELENGIQVQFAATGDYRTGDYWLIPARTATGQIEWPPCGSDGALFQSPATVDVYRAPLACIHWDTTQKFAIEDCRRSFPPLTEVAGGALSALHVSKINWSNDDFVTFDQLLANGLAVTFDQAPNSVIDGSIFSVVLEVPVISPLEGRAVAAGLTPIVLRTAMPLDGQVAVTGTQAVWNIPLRDSKGTILFIQLEAVFVIQAMLLQAINYSSFTRARVRLMGRDIFAASTSGSIYLDGQTLGTPGTRAGTATPRMDLSLPSGAGAQASDFESWFFLAPTLLLVTFTVQPAAVTFSPSVPSPPVPVATLTVNYPPLVDTVVSLSVVAPPGVTSAVTVPSKITVPRGKTSVTFNVGVRNTGTPTPQAYEIAASLDNALGLTSTLTAPLTVTGVVIIT
jgi:Family of unknown function (DUF6519)